MNRRESREAVFCLLYEMEFHPDSHCMEVYDTARESRELEENVYIRQTYAGTCEKIEQIDQIITAASVGWRADRMSRVSRAVLRLGVYEILFSDVPPKAAINEAVELAKKFDIESAPAFVNGVLNKVSKLEAGPSAEAGSSVETVESE